MFNIGDKIVCINDNFDIQFKTNHNYPHEENVYTVRDYFPSFAKNTHAVLLKEIINPMIEHPSGQGKFEPSFDAKRFVKADDIYQETKVKELEEIY